MRPGPACVIVHFPSRCGELDGSSTARGPPPIARGGGAAPEVFLSTPHPKPARIPRNPASTTQLRALRMTPVHASVGREFFSRRRGSDRQRVATAITRPHTEREVDAASEEELRPRYERP